MSKKQTIYEIMAIVTIILVIAGTMVFSNSAPAADSAAKPVKSNQDIWAYVLNNGEVIRELRPGEFFEFQGTLYFDVKQKDGKEQRVSWHGEYFTINPGKQEFLKQPEQK